MKQRIKILYCIDFLSYGGTEKQLMSLLNGIDRSQFQPHLCCLRSSIIGNNMRELALNLFHGIECPKLLLDYVSLRDPQSWGEILRIVRFIREHGIDVIHSFFPEPATVCLIVSGLAGVRKVAASFRDMGFWREDENDFKMKIVYRLHPYYLANSYAVKAYYSDLYDLPERKFTVIHNGIKIEKYYKVRLNRKRMPWKPVVGIVANLNRKVKRVDVFLRAAQFVARHMGDVRFAIAGDGDLKEELVRMSIELGIRDRVDFLGMVSDIPHLLGTMDVGVISSDSEGFSNSILEYMASGVPVVATDVGGNSEVISDGKTGYLVQPGDYTNLGERIVSLLTDEVCYRMIKEKAYEWVCKEFTMQKCISRHEECYKDMFNTERTG